MNANIETARTMAKNWRTGTTMERANIERAITHRNMWHMFRQSPSMGLVARMTDEDRERSLGSDCHFHSTSSPGLAL